MTDFDGFLSDFAGDFPKFFVEAGSEGGTCTGSRDENGIVKIGEDTAVLEAVAHVGLSVGGQADFDFIIQGSEGDGFVGSKFGESGCDLPVQGLDDRPTTQVVELYFTIEVFDGDIARDVGNGDFIAQTDFKVEAGVGGHGDVEFGA